MDIGTISVLVSLGILLSAGVANFFAYQKTTMAKVKDEIIKDQNVRIDQLEEERDRKNTELAAKLVRIEQLESEKQVPLNSLTQLVNNHQKMNNKLLKTIIALLKDNKT